MEEAPQNGKESSYSAHVNGVNKWINELINECMNEWMNEHYNCTTKFSFKPTQC